MTDENNTQRLPVADDTQVIGEPGDTRRLPETPASEPHPHEPAAPTAHAAGTPASPLVRTGPRTGTVVWGFLVVAVGVGVLAQAAGARIDVELATILLLGVAGALLVLGSLLGAARRRRDQTRA